MTSWDVEFLQAQHTLDTSSQRALVILNQPFSEGLLLQAVEFFTSGIAAPTEVQTVFLMSWVRHGVHCDLDSIRRDVKDFYISHGVLVVEDPDQDSTDLMKCVSAIQNREAEQQSDIILLGGLSGRLDQTIHTLSYLHKLRKTRKRVFAVTDDNVGWVLDTGEHTILIDHSVLGLTCGLLPVGIDSTLLTTTGLKWNLSNQRSSFDGLVSTSNHLVPTESSVWIKTSNPIWWTAELRSLAAPLGLRLSSPVV
ncbi:thiamine pyrophosphokinase Thi80 [Mycena vulgaris]|nr:thiamine pyrophosphokinase Thi80 [Mycena vulgaris]